MARLRRPGLAIAKYHGLGNDYLVARQGDLDACGVESGELAGTLCRAHYGMGADGLLVDCASNAGFALRIFNPDGSEAEKSGNGLRVFARYLYDQERVGQGKFAVHTQGGEAWCRVSDSGKLVQVDMGRVSFADGEANTSVKKVYVFNETFAYSYANLGNPHCVVRVDKPLTPDELARRGSALENHPAFPQRANVQFVLPLDRQRLAIQIWERGAGITEASGSSAVASAAVACSLGWCDSPLQVVMAGGELRIELDSVDGWLQARLVGPVTKVFSGTFYLEALAWVENQGPG